MSHAISLPTDAITAPKLATVPAAKPAKRARRRPPQMPTWQTTPCPAWCSGGHQENDHPDDRRHWGGSREVTQILAPPVRVVGDQYRPRNTYVTLEQHWLAADPTISVCDGDDSSVEYTIDEAEQLAAAILAAVQAARGSVAR